MSQVILEIPGVEGECQVKGYEKMIMCESLSHEIENEIEMTSNARRTVHIPTLNNFQMQRKWDKSSPGLLKKMLAAKSDQEWKIHCLKSIGDEGQMMVEFLTITLELPVLASFSLEVNEGDTTESFAINAVVVEWSYKPQKSDNTMEGGQIPIRFNTLSGEII